MLFLSVFASCDKSDLMDPETDPVSNVVNEWNMIVVMSDMNLGAELAYAECKNNLKALENLLVKNI